MRLDVAIVGHGTDGYLLDLLASVRERIPPERLGTVHVWDNASSDRSLAVLERFGSLVPWLRVHRSPVNVLHGPALDVLVREHVAGQWLLVLDVDTAVLADPVPALEPLLDGTPAFVGQVHPEPDHLYAYLCHLVLHVPTARTLPPFDAGGAPGAAFFRAVAARGLPWRRLRWVDLVRHHGQGALRGVARRDERGNPLFGFARDEAARAPAPAARAAFEARLAVQLEAFLGGGDVTSIGPSAAPPAPPPRVERPGAGRAGRVRLLSRIHPAGLVARARSMGLQGNAGAVRGLLDEVRRLAPGAVIDTGTRWGGSLLLLSAAAPRTAHVVAVEEPPWELDDPGEPGKRVRLASLLLPSQRLDLVRRASASLAARDEAAFRTDGRRAELLLLHGEEDAAGVLANLAPLLADGAAVAGPLDAPSFRALHERSARAGRLTLGTGPGSWGLFRD